MKQRQRTLRLLPVIDFRLRATIYITEIDGPLFNFTVYRYRYYFRTDLIADRCLLHKYTKSDYWRGRRVTCTTGLTTRSNYQIIAQLMNTYLINIHMLESFVHKD